VEVTNTAGLKEADAAIQFLDEAQTIVQWGWATDIPVEFVAPLKFEFRV
jgi:hypothetical protein